MVYVYLPFMLFPMTLGLSMVPREATEAASDLGATPLAGVPRDRAAAGHAGHHHRLLLTFVLARRAPSPSRSSSAASRSSRSRTTSRSPSPIAQNWPLGAALSVLLMLVVGVAGARGAAALRPRPHPGPALMRGGRRARCDALADRRSGPAAIVVFLYLPICRPGCSPSLSASRYFTFPIAKWGLAWWEQDLRLARDPRAARDLAHHRRHRHGDRRGDRLLRRARLRALRLARPLALPEDRAAADLLPAVGAGAGAAALVQRAGLRDVLADGGVRPPGLGRAGGDAGDLDPGLQLRPGAGGGGLRSRRQRAGRCCARSPCRCSGPGLFSGALFAFLLSWGNFPLSLFTTGADTTVPEYIYAKMVGGYTPGVPVLGTVSTVGAAVLLLGGYSLVLVWRRSRAR